MKQGDVWWVELSPPAGRRPALILTRTSILPRLSNVTAAPLTRTMRAVASEVNFGPADGLPTACAASLDNIFTAPRARFDRRIATLSAARMSEVFEAIRYAFDMPG